MNPCKVCLLAPSLEAKKKGLRLGAKLSVLIIAAPKGPLGAKSQANFFCPETRREEAYQILFFLSKSGPTRRVSLGTYGPHTLRFRRGVFLAPAISCHWQVSRLQLWLLRIGSLAHNFMLRLQEEAWCHGEAAVEQGACEAMEQA